MPFLQTDRFAHHRPLNVVILNGPLLTLQNGGGAQKGIVDPVMPLSVNLYRHPLAGLLWGKHLEEKLTQSGWKKATSLGVRLLP